MRPGSDRRVAEPLGELGDAPDVGPAEGVDRLVGVADHHEVAPITGDGLQQPLLGRVGVLVLVHDHEVVARPQRRASLRGLCVRDCACDELGVVEEHHGSP